MDLTVALAEEPTTLWPAMLTEFAVKDDGGTTADGCITGWIEEECLFQLCGRRHVDSARDVSAVELREHTD